MTVPIDEQVRTLMFGSELGDPSLRDAMEQELRERLADAQREGRPVRVYAGYDPSAPDLHLGHSITLRKLRQFQDFGHNVTFLVGTFTARVGDTSDKLAERPQLSSDRVMEAARTYAEQAFVILDRERTRVAYNHEWLAELTSEAIVPLAGHFTVQQFLVRESYRRRLDAGNPVGLHEFLYPLLQGYDAVKLEADVQIGATEQLFNIMAGRKLQTAFGQRPLVCITYPILVGTDGTMRMSKTAGNYIGLTEPPHEQYGKTMSISDETMLQWVKYVTRWPVDVIEERTRRMRSGELHPMELKKALAWEIVSTYHGDGAADEAQRRFETVHQEGRAPEEVEQVSVPGPTPIIDLLTRVNGVSSRSEARRLIDGRAVRLDGAAVESYEHVVERDCLLQVGKRRFVRVRFVR